MKRPTRLFINNSNAIVIEAAPIIEIAYLMMTGTLKRVVFILTTFSSYALRETERARPV